MFGPRRPQTSAWTLAYARLLLNRPIPIWMAAVAVLVVVLLARGSSGKLSASDFAHALELPGAVAALSSALKQKLAFDVFFDGVKEGKDLWKRFEDQGVHIAPVHYCESRRLCLSNVLPVQTRRT